VRWRFGARSGAGVRSAAVPAARAGTCILAAVLAAGFFGGCSRIAGYSAIVQANRLHERGRYQDAAAAYLSVEGRGFGPTLDYDLGNVYARLGEQGAASELYARARSAGDPAIEADAWFNEGVALYERGRFEDAWKSFRAALGAALGAPGAREADPGFVADARRNLELAWTAWKKRALAPPESAAPSTSREGGSVEDELRLFRRLETGSWRPGRGSPAGLAADDY
jgi:tetratricopeptide (TPR) repeat protein